MKGAFRIGAALLGVVLAQTMLPGGFVAAQDSPEAAAQKILAQAREAAGGDAKLKAVQSLTFGGKSKRAMRMMMGPGGGGGGQGQAPTMQEADFEVDILAPDKYVRRDTREVMNGAATIISHLGFNGDKLIQRMETIGDLPFQPNMGQGSDPAMQSALVRNAKQGFLRSWLGWALEPPAAYGLTYRSTGTEDVNNVKYDVVEAAGPDSFTAKLYFDAQSHRLALIRYRASGGMQMTRMSGGPPPGQGADVPTPPAGEGQQQRVFQRPSGPAPEADFEIEFSNHKLVDGIQVPHKITRKMNGEVNEETEIRKFKINSNPKADKFKTTE